MGRGMDWSCGAGGFGRGMRYCIWSAVLEHSVAFSEALDSHERFVRMFMNAVAPTSKTHIICS